MGDIIKKNIGKNTIGDSDKMSVNLKTYNRSTHDLSYVWRNTQSPGTLVPFMCEVSLPGDTHEISLEANVMTHPTVGPLFGSFKLQLDLFSCPIRLYNAALHNNRLGIGLNMANIKLPRIEVDLIKEYDQPLEEDQFRQIHPSSILAYLGLRGYGKLDESVSTNIVSKQCVALLAYWDIFKNYYANKQEEMAYYIGAGMQILELTAGATIYNPNQINTIIRMDGSSVFDITIEADEATAEMAQNIEIRYKYSGRRQEFTMPLSDAGNISVAANVITIEFNSVPEWGEAAITLISMRPAGIPQLKAFELANIDEMRDKILKTPNEQIFVINDEYEHQPFRDVATRIASGQLFTASAQFGLALKTYNSDLLNNWINTEWIDGEGGINEITAIDTTDGSFNLDTLNLAKKVYDMLNRIAISGGTYQDWIETVYTNEYIQRAETPVYEGGMAQEIVFQEVISNSGTEEEPLGSLAGRGLLAHKKRGGFAKIKTSEPSYIIGIASITPRLDYSQGNAWDTNLDTLDDLHKPALDAIGFQDLVTDWAAYWDTNIHTGNYNFRTAGKQPAWIQYMTNINKTYGNFALQNSEAFMVLNRNYEMGDDGYISDLTTYIDPAKFNYIFADTSLSAQNFWVQIGINHTARRKMSAKVIPNL